MNTTPLAKKVAIEQPTFLEQKLEGLKTRKPDKVNFALKIERMITEYRYSLYDSNMNANDIEIKRNDLIKSLEFTINRRAEIWGHNWRNKRLSKSDFKSAFYEVTLKLLNTYTWYQIFYFYEELRLKLHKKGLDIVRKLRTKQGKFDVNILPLKDEAAEFIADTQVDIETEIINNDLVERILNDSALTEQEKQLLQMIYNNPDMSNRDIAKVVGLNHHEQVTRLLKRIKRKLFYHFL
ncbi:Uncharacterized protein BWINRASL_05343 [Bacillus mycoides]|nr:Uncharacterized protein BWINRASL_05343 [Bacillus mycoides]